MFTKKKPTTITSYLKPNNYSIKVRILILVATFFLALILFVAMLLVIFLV